MDDDEKRELIEQLQEQLGVVPPPAPAPAPAERDVSAEIPDDESDSTEAFPDESVEEEPAQEDLELSEDEDETDEETLDPVAPVLNEFGGTELIGEKYRGTNWTITEIGADGFPMTLEHPAPFAKTVVHVGDQDGVDYVWEEEDLEEMYDKDLKYLGQLE